MTRKVTHSGSDPGRLIIHNTPHDIWAKLDWEVTEFQTKRMSGPPLDIDGMLYLLQNACISAVAAVEWLEIAAKRAARSRHRSFDGGAFRTSVGGWIPDLPLARAIANTFKHASYRDEGWGEAEIQLAVLFSEDQRARLQQAEGTDDFDSVYAEEAFEADYSLSFRRNETADQVEAGAFVLELRDGVLRLLDACASDLEEFFEPGEV